MSKNAATESLLGEIHLKMANKILAILDREEEPSVAALNLIRGFLSDNKCVMTPEVESSINELQKKLAERKNRLASVTQMPTSIAIG